MYFDLDTDIDSEGRLRTKLYDTRDDLIFLFVNLLLICTLQQNLRMYVVQRRQLIWYSRAWCSYHDFCDRAFQLASKLLIQGFRVIIGCPKRWLYLTLFVLFNITWRVPLPEHMSSSPVLCGTHVAHSLVLSWSLFVFFSLFHVFIVFSLLWFFLVSSSF